MQVTNTILDKALNQIKYSDHSEEDEFEFENIEQKQIEASENKSSEDQDDVNNYKSLNQDVDGESSDKKGSPVLSCTPNTASNSSKSSGSKK